MRSTYFVRTSVYIPFQKAPPSVPKERQLSRFGLKPSLRFAGISFMYDLGHWVSYKITYASSEDSDDTVHTSNLIRAFSGHSVGSQGSRRLQTKCENSGQAVQLRSLRRAPLLYCKSCCAPVEFYFAIL